MRVLFFGSLKDAAGRAEEAIDLPAGSRLQSIFDHYAGQFPRLKEMKGSVVMARNREFAAPDTPIAEGDEIALLPPVSGGSGRWLREIATEDGNFFALTRDKIETEELTARVRCDSDGALVCFEGVVRNNTKGRPTRYLEYECYEPMAIETMARIGGEIAREHGIGKIAMVHRLGRLGIGEASVVIAVAAPHRGAAFAAALEGINRLKRTVPIWKKEYFVDGAVWVDGEWDEALVRQGSGG